LFGAAARFLLKQRKQNLIAKLDHTFRLRRLMCGGGCAPPFDFLYFFLGLRP
jgi:hypothetical protein